MRFSIAIIVVGGALCWWGAEVKGQKPGISPGPRGVLSGVDYRVRLNWLTEPGAYGAGNFGRQFSLDKRDRYYEVHVPPSYTSGTAMPAVFVLHGGGGFASMMRSTTGMDKLSDKYGFIVVYCAGTNKQYSDRRLFWNVSKASQPDDIGYIKFILSDLPKYFQIDRDRIYATGISNGAQMTFRIGAELSEYFAAIGTVAGQRGPNEFSRVPVRPVALIHFHGKQDTWCPIDGGPGKSPRGEEPYQFQSVNAVIARWVKNNRSNPTPEVSLVGKAARRHLYAAEQDGVETQLWILEDAGHTWPGGPPSTRFQESRNVGAVNRDVSASELMWQFFERYRLNGRPE